jgi:hypothetical protein
MESVGFSVLASGAILNPMAKLIETVVVKDGGQECAVKVTIDAPNPEELDIPRLAQEAWLLSGKKLKIGNVTVSVKAFGRR